MSALAHRIRQARRAVSLTQSQLAERVGVNRSAVAQWERDGGTSPTSENLAKIAITAKVKFDWLATGRGRVRITDQQNQETPALVMRFFAQTDLEEKILLGFRAMPIEKQIALVALIGSGRE